MSSRNTQRLGTAIEIKKAIDSSRERLQPIGTCPEAIWEYQAEHYGEVSKEEDGESLDCIYELKRSLEEGFYSEFNFENLDLEIKINGQPFTLNISQEKLKELYQDGEIAGYGDAKTLETKTDPEVRSSKEITQIEVCPEITSNIEQNWSKIMYPKKVKAIPYKLNLYLGEDHFEEHLDTPDKNLVGTALVSLSSGGQSSAFSISDVNRKQKHYWGKYSPNCIMFYTDCPHRVESGNLKDVRATLAFKIYASENQEVLDLQRLETVMEHLEKLFNKTNTKGFILEHGYSLETESFTGSDALLIAALEKMGKKIQVLPIVYHFNLSVYHNDSEGGYWSSLVYPFTDKEIDFLLSDDETYTPDNFGENIEFCILTSKYFVWKNEHQNYAEWTGNESRPEEQNSVYLSRAVIV
jgi:hypothetical protein